MPASVVDDAIASLPGAPETTTPHCPVAKALAGSSGYLLARLGFAFKALATSAATDAGSDAHDYGVLAVLSEGARETQSAIADALGLDPSRLVAMLDSLESRGMVARQRDPHDRRRHLVSITAAGHEERDRLRVVFDRLEDQYLKPLGKAERRTLHELLLRLVVQNDPPCWDETAGVFGSRG